MRKISLLISLLFGSSLLAESPQNFYDFNAKNILGEEVSMSQYKNHVVLVVNVASKCGFTPQYKGLEKLYEKYNGSNFTILGFPCNQFHKQEPADEKAIQSFCEINYGVKFPLFAKIEVNGENSHPLYRYLKREKKGFLGTESIKWNFTKFLIDKKGRVLRRYGSATKPSEIEKDIKKLLK